MFPLIIISTNPLNEIILDLYNKYNKLNLEIINIQINLNYYFEIIFLNKFIYIFLISYTIIYIFIIILLNFILSIIATLIIATITLLERKILSIIQRRVGPNFVGYRGRLQYLADALKLIFKDSLIPLEANNFLFIMMPSIICSICYFFWVNSIWGSNLSIFDIEYNLVYVSILSILFSFCIVLSGYISKNKYSLLGSVRSLILVINLEIFLGLMVLNLVLFSESFCFNSFVVFQESQWFCFTFFNLLSLIFITFLLETNRAPFDLPEAESELVGGYHTEYGGFLFALYYLGEYFHLFFFASVLCILFFGGWELPNMLLNIFYSDLYSQFSLLKSISIFIMDTLELYIEEIQLHFKTKICIKYILISLKFRIKLLLLFIFKIILDFIWLSSFFFFNFMEFCVTFIYTLIGSFSNFRINLVNDLTLNIKHSYLLYFDYNIKSSIYLIKSGAYHLYIEFFSTFKYSKTTVLKIFYKKANIINNYPFSNHWGLRSLSCDLLLLNNQTINYFNGEIFINLHKLSDSNKFYYFYVKKIVSYIYYSIINLKYTLCYYFY